jgi:molybdopterin converting factor subunit 1
MTIRIKLFAAARERIARDEIEIDLPADATIADLKRAIETKFDALAPILPHALWAINAEYATDNTPIHEHDELALIPPVSGG